MRAGQLRQRIKIQKFNAEGRDGSGMQNGEVWEDYATVWANVDDLSTRDIIADRAAQGTMQARATIRYSQRLHLLIRHIECYLRASSIGSMATRLLTQVVVVNT